MACKLCTNAIKRLCRKHFILCVLCVVVLLSACSNIDCPLDNVVSMQCNLYAAETKSPMTLYDELSVTPAGRDTVLLNKATEISSFLLPLKESGTRDTLLLHFRTCLVKTQSTPYL